MSGARSRRKGAAAERELARLLFEELGVEVRRNLEQCRAGGFDLEADESDTILLARYAIEVKRHRQATPALLRAWWGQASHQAEQARRTPALAYRGDRAPWHVVVPLTAISPDLPTGGLDYTATLSLPGFCALVRERLPI